MSDWIKNVLIGIFVIVAILSTIYLILFLQPKIGDQKKTLRVRFSNIAGINVGTRVTLAGKAVGEVTKIDVVKGAREGPVDTLGRVFFYILTLKVDSSVEVYNTDEITIATTGLLGEKSVAIVPKAGKKGVIPKNISKEIIYSNSVEPLENVVYQLGSLADKMEETLGNVNVWFLENEDELSGAVHNFSTFMKGVSEMADSINKEKLICSIKEAADRFSEDLCLIQKSLQEVQDKDMIAKFDVILENFAEASEYINKDGSQILCNVNKITKEIADGKGTIGKLIKCDDFYLRLTAILGKVDTLMNDINHYGILFQYDKNWQRIRTKKANILQALNTPKEFKHYFETEVDTVTTALSRISILLEKANGAQEKERIIKSTCFQKDFCILLNQVEHLLDSLKLYNEQIAETLNADN
jgi:phospholipid/cholesterol/gamma-HCH transport system substrate-binding protein